MKKIIALLICSVILFYLAPVGSSAAQASGTLSPGRTYAFVNSDERTVSYVSVGGGVSYDYVSVNSQGETADYGIGIGRAAVRGGGSTLIRVNGKSSASASYDSSKISYTEKAARALCRIDVSESETVRLTSSSDIPLNISIDNTGRDEYSKYDVSVYKKNTVPAFFADECKFTSLSIPSEGRADITPVGGGLTVMFPESWVGTSVVSETITEPALIYAELSYDTPYTLTNEGAAECVAGVRGGGTVSYDYIKMDDEGYTTVFGSEEKAERIYISAFETLTMTPVRPTNPDEGTRLIKLMYPSGQQGLLAGQGGDGSLVSYSAEEGETLIVTNDGKTPFTFRAKQDDPASTINYSYEGGLYKSVRSSSGETFNEFTIEPGYKWTLTVVKVPLTLSFPSSWQKGGLSAVKGGAPAFNDLALKVNESLSITNKSVDFDCEIRILPPQSRNEVKYDYTMRGGQDVSFQEKCSDESITVKPGYGVTLTAGAEIFVRVPSGDHIAVSSVNGDALTRYSFGKGVSYLIRNASESREFEIAPEAVLNVSVKDEVIDFVTCDGDGEIQSFGFKKIGDPFTVGFGESTLITNLCETEAEILIPTVLLDEGLSIAETDATALFKRTLRDGQGLELVNSDKKYNHTFAVFGASNSPSDFDFVSRDEKAILEYGIGGAGFHTLYGGGKVSLAPSKGSEIVVCYPDEFNDLLINTQATQTAPLYKRIIEPGERVVLTNKTKADIAIQNSSQNGAAKYFVNEGTRAVKAGKDEKPVAGEIQVPAQSSVTVTVATGADLEIWMPFEWAKSVVR